MAFMNEVHREKMHRINALFEMLLAYESEPTEENVLKVDALFEA